MVQHRSDDEQSTLGDLFSRDPIAERLYDLLSQIEVEMAESTVPVVPTVPPSDVSSVEGGNAPQAADSVVGVPGNLQTANSAQQPRVILNTTDAFAGYFQGLGDSLPNMGELLAAARIPYQPPLSFSDALACLVAVAPQAGPIAGAGVHPVALEGLRRLTEDEKLNLVIRLDLSVRMFRHKAGYLAAALWRESGFAQQKLQEMELEREMLDRTRDMFHSEGDMLEQEKSHFHRELEIFATAKAAYDRDILRFGGALDLGTTIEQIQASGDQLMERLRAVLESQLNQGTAQLQALANMGVSGGIQQWLERSNEIIRRTSEHNASAVQSRAVEQTQIAEQESRHKAEMQKLQDENEKLKKRLEDFTNELRETRIEDNDDRSILASWTWGCAMM